MILILFGVSGTGKTTIGRLLSERLGWRFVEADDYHSLANRQKMQAGIPLTDEDRQPWLDVLHQRIAELIAQTSRDRDAPLLVDRIRKSSVEHRR